MVNLTALNNLTNPEFNTTIINNSQNITNEIFNNANNSAEGYFGLIIYTIFAIWLFYQMFREDGFFRYDLIKAGAIATGVSTIFGIILILGDLVSSWQHVMWFAILFVIFVIAAFIQKDES